MKWNEEPKTEQQRNTRTWLKRIGIAGFVFFLVKGLVWIAIWVFAAKSCA